MRCAQAEPKQFSTGSSGFMASTKAWKHTKTSRCVSLCRAFRATLWRSLTSFSEFQCFDVFDVLAFTTFVRQVWFCQRCTILHNIAQYLVII